MIETSQRMDAGPLGMKLDSLPNAPGVYIMKNRASKVIYVGKARDLKKRVLYYFRDAPKDPKTRQLTGQIADFDIIVTDTEVEALLTEATLIKEHRPKYNVTLKDDKNYLSLRIDPREEFPRFTLVRSMKRDGALYFGPYTDAKAVRKSFKWLSSTFRIRQCTDFKFKNRTRPCIYYEIDQCTGPCVNKISQEEYKKNIEQTILFLKGKDEELVNNLTDLMAFLSEDMRYEEAALIRDRIAAIGKMVSVQKVVSNDTTDRDVVGIYREGTSLGISVLFVRSGRLTGSRYGLFTSVLSEDGEAIQSFIEQFYHAKDYVPPQILLPTEIPEPELVHQWLGSVAPVELRVPKRGILRDLVGMANKNAESSYMTYKQSKESREQSLLVLAQRLGLTSPPKRMECYDISTISGTNAVGSMVVFSEGEPDKKEYRRFRIKGVAGIDDYAMMEEVLRRRIKRLSPENHPDLIVIDGGKGHLSIAHSVLKDLDVTDIPVISIAKEREDKAELDKVYLVGRKNPLVAKGNSSALFLLMRLRDEAHRFAIEYHKKLRQKRGVASALDEIPGIGQKRKRALLVHFSRVADIKDASIEELTGVPGITESVARSIRDYFNPHPDR